MGYGASFVLRTAGLSALGAARRRSRAYPFVLRTAGLSVLGAARRRSCTFLPEHRHI